MNDVPGADDIRIPRRALHVLASAATRDGEPLLSLIREAGRVAGEAITRGIAAEVPLAELDMTDFWTAVNAESGSRSLGTFDWQDPVGGHAELVVLGAADSGLPGPETGAPFTEGLLEGLLAAAVGEPVAVVQAPEDGGRAMRFLVGAPTALRHVSLRLRSGASLEQALEGI
jgi:hypothetical protein